MIRRPMVILTALSATLAIGGLACRRSEPPPKIEFVPGQFVSAKKCGACHKDIYRAWRQSLHAAATEDPIFRKSYEDALELTHGQAKRLCLTCHAPTVVVTGDYDLTQPVTREGINCDFCHSLKGTDFSQPQSPFVLDVGATKYGPVPDAASTGHQVAYSPFHTTALHCAGCHQYRNAHGVELLSTYAEWEQYTERGGTKTCQQCHMPQVLANIVDPKVKRVEGAFVNLHLMPGGHSRDQLVKSLRLRIMEMTRTPKGLRVKVKVKNVGAGHMVPTGSPTRKVILNLDVSTGSGRRFHADRLYQRIVLDERGRPIRKDSRMFTEARRIERDTRLAPGEERIEEFLLPVPASENAKVTATLTYFYSPHDRPETETRIDFMTETKQLLARWERQP
ncbi:MAG: hypothetical protein D6723_18490 [Acidobacteria bacterium]|nr:MAG: hypothetical protein D6723_18490 [Acidobacteriota bacterium]